ncbi:MAG: hypothetical protein AB7F86_02350 [Bdellovibrionales bacterium]
MWTRGHIWREMKLVSIKTGLSVCLWVFAFSFTLFAIQSGDALIYLAIARDILLKGEWHNIPDPYAYTGQHSLLIWTHEYLSYLLFWWASEAAGLAGLILFKALVWGAVFLIVLRSKPTVQNTSWLWMAAWAMAVLAGSFRFIERSSMLSDLLTVWLVYDLIDREKVERTWLFRTTLLFALWVNLHPGFPIGFALLLIWAIHRTWIAKTITLRQWPWLLLPVLATCVHPELWRGLSYPFEFAAGSEASIFKKYNFEWMPPYHPLFRWAPETVAFWCLVGLTFFTLLRERSWFSLRTWFALFSLAMALKAVRFVPWVSFSLLICIKPWCELKLISNFPRRFAATLVGVLLLAIAIKNVTLGYRASSGARLPTWGLDPKFFPVQTVQFLRNQPIPGRLYNSHDLGGYLIWTKMTPVFHHGFMTDMEFYEKEVIGVLNSKAEFDRLAEKYNWTMLLVERYGTFFRWRQILIDDPRWRIVAEDEASYLIYKF